MHYIRFLKPPRLLPNAPPAVSAKITVTTDLGESFLWANVELVVELQDGDGVSVSMAKEYVWKGADGMRSLEISIPLPTNKKRNSEQIVRMLLRPNEGKYAMDIYDDILSGGGVSNSGDIGGIVTVRSMPLSTNPSTSHQNSNGMAERVFTSGNNSIHVWEETGESIARHIWDAGLMISAYLTTLSPLTAATIPSKVLPSFPILSQTLSKKNLNILELGAGCGIVGITLHKFFPTSKVLLTDLPEASEIISRNLSLLTYPPHQPQHQTPAQLQGRITHEILDWSSPKPLPPPIASETWDLIIIADCTYNPDVVPDLVSTLKIIGGEKSPGMLVVVAMKVRHESELIFFDLMNEAGIGVVEKGVLGVPVLGGEGEEIEIFSFRLQGRGGGIS